MTRIVTFLQNMRVHTEIIDTVHLAHTLIFTILTKAAMPFLALFLFK